MFTTMKNYEFKVLEEFWRTVSAGTEFHYCPIEWNGRQFLITLTWIVKDPWVATIVEVVPEGKLLVKSDKFKMPMKLDIRFRSRKEVEAVKITTLHLVNNMIRRGDFNG